MHPAVWPQKTWAENWRRLLPLFGEGVLGPHLTRSHLGRGLLPYQLPSGILIHPAIWPQRIWAEKWGLCAFGGGEVGPI